MQTSTYKQTDRQTDREREREIERERNRHIVLCSLFVFFSSFFLFLFFFYYFINRCLTKSSWLKIYKGMINNNNKLNIFNG